jgi:hypothetical protein
MFALDAQPGIARRFEPRESYEILVWTPAPNPASTAPPDFGP